MVLADPGPGDMGLGLEAEGAAVPDESDGGGDDGLGGGLDVRVSGGDETLPWRKIKAEEHLIHDRMIASPIFLK